MNNNNVLTESVFTFNLSLDFALAKPFKFPFAVTPTLNVINSNSFIYSTLIISSFSIRLNNCVPKIFLGVSSILGSSKLNFNPNLLSTFKNSFYSLLSKISISNTNSFSFNLIA